MSISSFLDNSSSSSSSAYPYFSLDPTTGILKLENDLFFDIVDQSIDLDVEVRDNGFPSKSDL